MKAGEGKFIVVEGGEGAGKDTQIDLLKEKFSPEEVVFTREPGGTEVGKALRALLLDGTHPVSKNAEVFMFLADRAQHMAELVTPSLQNGQHVISNRSWISFIAYQVYGREQEHLLPLIEMAHKEIYKDQEPDLVIFLDVDPEIGLERTKKRGSMNVIDRAPLEFHKCVQKGFQKALENMQSVATIDASRSIEEVQEEVYDVVKKVMG